MIRSAYLNILVNLIIKTYLKESICIMHTFDTNTDPVHILAPSILTENVANFHLDTQKICRHFLLQCDNATNALTNIEHVIKYNSDGLYNNRKYIIIIKTQETFKEFFQSPSLRFIRDVLVIYLEDVEKEMVRLYTHKYVGTENNNEPILLDIWYIDKQNFKFSNVLFPDKVTNQQERELRVICAPDLPFANCESNFSRVLGNEHNIVVKYAQIFNLTLKVHSEDTEDYGYIWANWSSAGLSSSLVINGDDYTDVLYGGIPERSHIDRTRSVRYIYEVSVPLPKQKYGWYMSLEVFKLGTWLLIAVFFAVARLLVYLYKHLRPANKVAQSEMCNIEMYAFFVNQSTTLTSDIESSSFLKYVVLVVLFSSVLLASAYNSRLSSVLVAPIYEGNIETLDEFSTSKYDLLFFDPYYNILKEDTRSVYKKILRKIYLIPNNTDYELSEKLLSSTKYAVARYRRSSGGYYEDIEHLQQIYGRYKTISPELFTNYYYIMTRMNSMHTDEIRKLVQTVEEVGLMYFWEQEGLRVDGNTTFHRKMQDNVVQNVNDTLGMKHLKGCFVFWLGGLVAALIAFIKENISFWYSSRRLKG